MFGPHCASLDRVHVGAQSRQAERLPPDDALLRLRDGDSTQFFATRRCAHVWTAADVAFVRVISEKTLAPEQSKLFGDERRARTGDLHDHGGNLLRSAYRHDGRSDAPSLIVFFPSLHARSYHEHQTHASALPGLSRTNIKI